MTNDEYKTICLKSVSGTHLVLKLEIKIKTKINFQVDQVVSFQVISSEYQGWFFGQRSLRSRLGWLKLKW